MILPGPVGWKVIWKLPGPVFKPIPPLAVGPTSHVGVASDLHSKYSLHILLVYRLHRLVDPSHLDTEFDSISYLAYGQLTSLATI